jgi:hypothetical protein
MPRIEVEKNGDIFLRNEDGGSCYIHDGTPIRILDEALNARDLPVEVAGKLRMWKAENKKRVKH